MQLDYNLLLGHSYMYAMRAVASSVFHTMMFPHEGRMVKVDQLTYHDPSAPATPENVLPMVEQPVSSATTSVVSSMGPRVYSDEPMTSTFQSIPPPSPALTCMTYVPCPIIRELLLINHPHGIHVATAK